MILNVKKKFAKDIEKKDFKQDYGSLINAFTIIIECFF